MTMMIVPTQALPNQSLQVQLGGQAVTLNIVQFAYGMFMTVTLGTNIIAASVISQNLNRIVRYAYLGFIGDFVFVDTQGTEDPIYTGLGSRFLLVYLSPADLSALGLAG
jgi:hypothetical protein